LMYEHLKNSHPANKEEEITDTDKKPDEKSP
jgi:hypothetical protein